MYEGWQPRADGWATIREWTRGVGAGGEEIFGKPQERSFAQKSLVTAMDEARPHESRCVSDGEAKVTRAARAET